MQLDITTLTSQGVTPWDPQWISFPSNPRNSFAYEIKYLNHVYSNEQSILIARYAVKRYALYNGEMKLDISFVFDSVANDQTYVDKFGNIVPQFIEVEGTNIENPVVWGTEFNRMRVIAAAPIGTKTVAESYLEDLFNRGLLDKPKNNAL